MQIPLIIPGSVPLRAQEIYTTNWQTLTAQTGFLFFLAGDQRLEHQDNDLKQNVTILESWYPSHMFRIALKSNIPLATHYGFVAQYGTQFPTIPYIIKMTGTTNIVSPEQQDPLSTPLATIDDIITLQKNTQLIVSAVGISLYSGSIYEPEMLSYAARTIIKAHEHGLITIVWIYVRGRHITAKNNVTSAGLACIASAIGADFVVIKPTPGATDEEKIQAMRTITICAERMGVISTGGEYTTDIHALLHTASLYKHKGHAQGLALGRNGVNRSLSEASALCMAFKEIIHGNRDSQTAYELYKKMIEK